MVVVCHENLTRGFYTGLSRESMVTNALFRAGASAMMFSTDPSLKAQAKFKLEYSTRTYQVRTDATRTLHLLLSHCCPIVASMLLRAPYLPDPLY